MASPTPPQATFDFDRAVSTLTATEGQLLALLALSEPMRISHFSDVVGLSGLRETPSRKYSGVTLRPILERLIGLGLVRDTDGSFELSRTPGRTMRWVVARPDVDRLASAAGGHMTRPKGAQLAIYRGQASAVDELERLRAYGREAVESLVLEATEPFAPAWFEALPYGLRRYLMETAMVGLERSGRAELGLYRHLAEQLDRLEGQSEACVLAVGGVAVLRGELDVVRRLAETAPYLPVRGWMTVAIAMVEGRDGDAARALDAVPHPKQGFHTGVVFLLATLAERSRSIRSDRLSRMVTLGARKGSPLQQSFRALEAVVEQDRGALFASVRLGRDFTPDILSELVESMLPSLALETYSGARVARGLANTARLLHFPWLAEQSAHAAARVSEAIGVKEVTGDLRLPAAKMKHGPSITVPRAPAAAWVAALDKLDSVLEKVRPGPAQKEEAAASGERIIWRTRGLRHSLEPHVQKRGANGKWTGGRKLAVKHLIGRTPTTAVLPPEDLRVAGHAREYREATYPYPTVYHTLEQSAWLDLIGHPRVHCEDEDTPREVVRGEVKVTVRSDRNLSFVDVDPPDLDEGICVRAKGTQLVVYSLDPAVEKLLPVLPVRTGIPAEGKARLLSALEKIAALVPVESSEHVEAKRVAADAAPYVRLIPVQSGLSVTILVRPLGAGSVAATPGRGAPTLLHHVGGVAVQTSRDLAAEEARAESVADACALPEADAGVFSWRLEDPEACLGLVAALRDLGDVVRVEWPQGSPLKLRARVGRRALRGKLTTALGVFSIEGSLSIDSELEVSLAEMLELLAQHPGRFVKLASGEYVELERDLRDTLSSIAASRDHGAPAGKVVLPGAALAALDQLTSDGSGLQLDPRAVAWRERFDQVFGRKPALPKTFQGELRDYQLEGFRWLARLAEMEMGACLADDMGLGKTIQIVALLLHRAAAGPALVVAPTSVCEGWRRELERFGPSLRVRLHAGANREETLSGLKKRDVVVTSYTLLQQDAEAFAALEWATAVLDEAQLIKNPDTLRAKAAFGLKARARVAATGTPVENHAGDLFSLFHFLNPGLLGSFRSFAAKMGERGSGERGSGARGHGRVIAPFILRRTKAQVLDDLPPITEIERTVLMTPGEAKLYDAVRKVALAKLDDARAASSSAAGKAKAGQARIQVLAELTRLRRLCCHPKLVAPDADLSSSKLESFIELVEELVEGRHRALVFSQFTDVLAMARTLLDTKGVTYQYLDGSTPPKQRSAAIDAFQEGQGDVFLISLRAGGFGLNLTAADYVIHLDPWWNPAVESQATDRAHRIGQTRPVTVYRLVTTGTIESRIVELHREKRELADAVLADTDRAATLTADEIRSLLT